MAASAADHNALDWRFADQARLTFAAIHTLLKLEKACVAVSIHVVGNRGTTGCNRFLEDFLYGEVQTPKLFTAQCCRTASRTYAGPEQRLIGVDVAHPAEQFLVEQSPLDWRLTSAEQIDEFFYFNFERLRSRCLKFVGDAQPPEAAGIDKEHFPAGCEARNRMCVLFNFGRGIADQHASGHAEVNDPLSGPVLCGADTLVRLPCLCGADTLIRRLFAAALPARLYGRRRPPHTARFQVKNNVL